LRHNGKISAKQNNKTEIKEALYLIKRKSSEDDNKALNLVNEALKEKLSDLDKAIVHYVRGTVYFRKKQYKRALEETKLALEKDPSFGNDKILTYSALLQLAFIYEDMGKFKESIVQFNKTVEMLQTLFDSNKIKSLLAGAHLEFALFYARNSKIKSSKEKMLLNLQRIIELDPEYPEVYFYLGLFYYDNSLYYRALENFNQFLDLVPPDIPLYQEMIETAKENVKELGGLFE